MKIPISVVLYWQRMELARSHCGQIKTTSWRLTYYVSERNWSTDEIQAHK
jgi:hypothetical protein